MVEMQNLHRRDRGTKFLYADTKWKAKNYAIKQENGFVAPQDASGKPGIEAAVP